MRQAKQPFRIRLYADSLALPRPSLVENHERYFRRLQEWWAAHNAVLPFEICERDKANSTIGFLLDWYSHDVKYFGSGDVLLIHCGICDCAPRPVPLPVREQISKMPEWLRTWIVKFLHFARPALLKMGVSWRNTEPAAYERFLRMWLMDAKDKFSRIYVINIAPTNAVMESHSPGISESIVQYNRIIASTMDEFKDQPIHLIDMNRLIAEKNDLNSYILETDGHHYKEPSHRLCAEEIIKLEQRYLPCSPG
jgi:hypothetical protein